MSLDLPVASLATAVVTLVWTLYFQRRTLTQHDRERLQTEQEMDRVALQNKLYDREQALTTTKMQLLRAEQERDQYYRENVELTRRLSRLE